MGLMAVVYKSRTSLEKQFEGKAFDVDEHTGEAVLLEMKDASIAPAAYIAGSARFGNVAQIAHLSRTVAELLGTMDTLIQRSVLYSGSHSGDIIEVDGIAKLMGEVDKISESESDDVRNFGQLLRNLANMAQQERNPIVFV